MNTVKFFSKLLIKIFLLIFSLIVVGTILFFSLSFYTMYDHKSNRLTPPYLYKSIIENGSIQFSPKLKDDLKNNNIWIMVLNDSGEIKDSLNLPQKLQKKYSLSDVAKFSRWYLEDYPVFTYVFEDSLIIIGYPVNYYDKFPSNYYNFELLKEILIIGLSIFLSIVLIILIIYLKTKSNFLKEIKPIKNALINLSNNKSTSIDENGNLSEIKEAINHTSNILEETKRMKSHWIRGVSHDLRNPLTLIIAKIEKLEKKIGTNKEIEDIKQQIELMQEILKNFNFSFLLDDKDYSKTFIPLSINSISREIIVEYFNSYENINIDFNIPKEDYFIYGNKILIDRIIRNILNNSINHNKNIKIKFGIIKDSDNIIIEISDNGNISEENIKLLQNKTTNYDSHGMGIVIVKQIINIHNAKVEFSYNNPGLKTKLIFKEAQKNTTI